MHSLLGNIGIKPFLYATLGAALLVVLAVIQKLATGAPLIAEGFFVPIFFGSVAGFVIGLSLRTIQLQKLSHQALSRAEARLNEAQRIARMGNWDWDIATGDLWWSDEIYRIFGARPGAFKATYDVFIEAVHPDDRALVAQSVNAALHENKPYNIEHRIALPDGSERIVHEQAKVTFDESGAPVKMMGTVHDITERKEADRLLLFSEEQNRLLLASVGDGIFGLDPDGYTTFINPAACEMLGYSEGELIGQLTHAFIHHSHSDGTPYSYEECQLCAAFRDGKMHHITDEVMWRKDGSHFPVECASTPIFKDEEIIGAVVTFKDITKRKKAEDELKISREQLKHEIRTKDRFFSIIAHDLRSPFNALLGMTDMMANMSDSFSREDLTEYAMHTNQAGNRVFELLQNLLDWSLLQMEGTTLEQKMVPLRGIAHKSIEVLKPVAQQKEIELINEIQETTVFSDPNMVDTVIRNLVANALKFTPSGGSVTVSSLQDGDMAQVMVSDTGVGMSEEQAKTIFSLDQRTSTTGTAGEEGTGLGLPLCREMVEKNGGRIWAESDPGEGSAFFFTMRTSE